jgi:hypothetical protein
MLRYKCLSGLIVILFVFGVLTIDSALAGEKVKGTATSVRTKWQPIEVGDEEGHIIAVYENTNVYHSAQGEQKPTGISTGIVDMNVKTGQGTLKGYVVISYPNGDKLHLKTEGQLLGSGKTEGTAVYVGGTGRFEGAKGSVVWKSKSLEPGISFLESEGEMELSGK